MALPETPFWLPLFFTLMATALVMALPMAVRSSGARLALRPDLVRRRVLLAGSVALSWLALTGALATSGVLLRFETVPPPMFLMLAAMLLGSLAVAFSPLGSQLAKGCTLAGLVGLQSFRLPLELAMHQAAEIGLMPPQMSFEGRNFDILTGILALILGLLLARGKDLPKPMLWAWNILGLGLLINVVAVALLSMPLPFRMFHNEPANVWVCHPPYVWLPAVMVSTALIGHLLLFRRLSKPGH